MKTRFTPYYIDLVYDACLKSFWRKRALANFLRLCQVPESSLNSWGTEESKREFLDRLFVDLSTNDKGRGITLSMSKNLMEQRTFPDLENWEDSSQKIADAKKSINCLIEYHNKQEEELQTEEAKKQARKSFLQRQDDISRSQKTLQEFNDRLNNLGQKIGTQQAGYDFQDWFYNFLDFSEIVNRKPYVHSGRQIDGSITISDTTYLVELKFTTEQAGAKDIDSFYKKVTSKADNTMGIMVSISGYSSVAIEEASGDKTPLLLLDHSHLYLVLGGIMGISDVIHRIRRHSSQTGEAYLKADQFTK